MFIFSRRALQACLNDLEKFKDLSEHQLTNLVSRLNSNVQDRISAMWEVVFLTAIGRVGRFEHEKRLEGSRKEPDFSLPIDCNGQKLHLVGDITAASDAGAHSQNPVSYLSDEIVRLAKKNKLDPHHFGLQVKGNLTGDYKNTKMLLSLPVKHSIQKVIKESIEPFIRGLALDKPKEKKLNVRVDQADFDVCYDVSQMYFSVGHPLYTPIFSIRKNNIAYQLKDKATQLRGAPEAALRLIILCDGGCDAMRDSLMPKLDYRADDIVVDFFKQTNSVDFVLLVNVIESGEGVGSRDLRLNFKLLSAPIGRRSSRVTGDSIKAVEEAVNEAIKFLPHPVHTPSNAASNVSESSIGTNSRGGFSCSGKNVKISLRTLQALLAGEIDGNEFASLHSAGGNGFVQNIFKSKLAQGRLVTSIKIIPGGDKDDDWVDFEFGRPDAAVSDFRIE